MRVVWHVTINDENVTIGVLGQVQVLNVHMIESHLSLHLVRASVLINNLDTDVLEKVLISSAGNFNVQTRIIFCDLEIVLAEKVSTVSSQRKEVSSVMLRVELLHLLHVVRAGHKLDFAHACADPDRATKGSELLRLKPKRFLHRLVMSKSQSLTLEVLFQREVHIGIHT